MLAELLKSGWIKFGSPNSSRVGFSDCVANHMYQVTIEACGFLSYIRLSFSFLVGSLCNCILPQALKVSAIRHKPNFRNYENEKKNLRSGFSCLSSISMHQKEVSLSSLFLHSHYKGCLPPWELKTSRNTRLKEG